MTWRQIRFIEGFNRSHRNEIEIKGMQTSDVNGMLRLSEMKKLGLIIYPLSEMGNFISVVVCWLLLILESDQWVHSLLR